MSNISAIVNSPKAKRIMTTITLSYKMNLYKGLSSMSSRTNIGLDVFQYVIL